MKTLVTGGLGFIGAALVRAMVARGDDVRILDNSSRGSVEKLGESIEKVELLTGDIRDPRVVRESVRGVQRVVHLAFINGTEYFYRYPTFVLDVGVKGMVNVIDSCLEEGVKDFVLASSSEVYQTPPIVPTPESAPLSVPDPLNPRYSYGGAKIICELMAINYGRNHFNRMTIFRPHNVFGPMMGYEHVIPQFVERLRTLSIQYPNQPVPFSIQGSGSQTRAFIYIDDFTNGLLRVIDHGKHMEVYHIGTMEEITIAALAMKIAECMDLSIALQPGPEAIGGTMRRCPETTKVQSLGFVPTISLQEGLQRTVSWYESHPAPTQRTISEPSLFPLPSCRPMAPLAAAKHAEQSN